MSDFMRRICYPCDARDASGFQKALWLQLRVNLWCVAKRWLKEAPPTGVEQDDESTKNTRENGTFEEMNEDECADECATTSKMTLQDLLKMELPEQLLLKILKQLQV